MSLSSKHQIKARYGLIDLGLWALLNLAASILAIPSLESYRPALTKQLAHFLVFEPVSGLWVQVFHLPSESTGLYVQDCHAH